MIQVMSLEQFVIGFMQRTEASREEKPEIKAPKRKSEKKRKAR